MKRAVFIKSAEKPTDFPPETLPEVAVIGRSNVGKSTLINHLVSQKIAKTSQNPGKTRLINFFDLGSFLLVDLPGFGFASAPKEERVRFGERVEAYLRTRTTLSVVLLLVDVTRDPKEEIALYEWLLEKKIPVIIVATKCDKPTQSGLHQGLLRIAEAFSKSPDEIIRFSIKDPRCRVRLLSEVQKMYEK